MITGQYFPVFIMTDLFDEASKLRSPLPSRMRPGSFDDFVGQNSLISRLRGRPLHSMILYGPPGCGKTTLARLLSENSSNDFYTLSAVSSGIKEVREVIALGKQKTGAEKGDTLFIDEIHRFSKSQQDALLEAVESGWITLIGATTENPSFEVIGPLLSRCQVYRLISLSNEDLLKILERSLLTDEKLKGIKISERAKEMLIDLSGGDARRMLIVLETSVEHVRSEKNGIDEITPEIISKIVENSVRYYDKTGENHYDYISAFIKSLRGSDPDAALLYMAVMLEAGEDPLFIARRMIIFASEDIGNASPQALTLAVSAFQAVERIGMPEGRIVLSQTAVFLASSPKSNSSYTAIDDALKAVRGKKVPVPNHLRNAPTPTHKAEGASKGYRYPHDYPGHFVDGRYLPEGFEKSHFYRPGDLGQESKIKERLKTFWTERKYD